MAQRIDASRKERIRQLRGLGYKVSTIMERLGVCRQAIHDAMNGPRKKPLTYHEKDQERLKDVPSVPDDLCRRIDVLNPFEESIANMQIEAALAAIRAKDTAEDLRGRMPYEVPVAITHQSRRSVSGAEY